MTTPESITVSLEYAKKLKEAGWPQEAVWYWPVHYVNGHIFALATETHPRSENNALDYFAAPTAEEILQRLPEYVGTQFWSIIAEGHVRDGRKVMGYTIYYPTKHEEWSDTLANAAAAMYCHLAENGLLPTA